MDITLSGPIWQFTLQIIEATDRLSQFNAGTYFHPAPATVPQYVYRLGYYLSDNFSLSLGMDHQKYVMKQGQSALISGVIDTTYSQLFGGVYLLDTMKINPSFLSFEHTNGLNLFSLDAEYTMASKKIIGILYLDWRMGIGLTGIMAKTDVRIMDYGLYNRFNLSG